VLIPGSESRAFYFYLLLFAVSFTMSACSDPQPSNPTSVQDLSGGHNISAINPDFILEQPDVLTVVIRDNHSLVTFAMTVKSIIADAKERMPQILTNNSGILFIQETEISDQYGNPGHDYALAVGWKTSDIAKMNFADGGINAFQILNLAAGIADMGVGAPRLLDKACTENLTYLRQFCVLAVESIGKISVHDIARVISAHAADNQSMIMPDEATELEIAAAEGEASMIDCHVVTKDANGKATVRDKPNGKSILGYIGNKQKFKAWDAGLEKDDKGIEWRWIYFPESQESRGWVADKLTKCDG